MKAQLGTVFALAAGFLLAGAGPAFAEHPVSLDGGYVIDSVDAVGGDGPRIISALDSLYDTTGIQLFVVYVDEFTNPGLPLEWADTTAAINGLGDEDLLLAVAISQRQYALSFAENSSVTDGHLDDAEAAFRCFLCWEVPPWSAPVRTRFIAYAAVGGELAGTNPLMVSLKRS